MRLHMPNPHRQHTSCGPLLKAVTLQHPTTRVRPGRAGRAQGADAARPRIRSCPARPRVVPEHVRQARRIFLLQRAQQGFRFWQCTRRHAVQLGERLGRQRELLRRAAGQLRQQALPQRVQRGRHGVAARPERGPAQEEGPAMVGVLGEAVRS